MGTKIKIWRQGQFYPLLGEKIIELPYDVAPGPSDAKLRIGGKIVSPDKDGHFISSRYTEQEMDAIRTYGTARMVIDLYEKLLNKQVLWSWRTLNNDAPLTISIYKNDINARYLKKYKCIELDYYGPHNAWIYNCRTVDIIAHETAHAVLDGLKPEWESSDAETRGITEAFCDLTAMYLVLIQDDLIKIVLKETKGDLCRESILAIFGMGHGPSERPIRSALNKTVYPEERWDTYAYANVLTGMLYELLIYEFKSKCKKHSKSMNCLASCGQQWMQMITQAFIMCDDNKSSVLEVCENLASLWPERKDLIKKHLTERKVPS